MLSLSYIHRTGNNSNFFSDALFLAFKTYPLDDIMIGSQQFKQCTYPTCLLQLNALISNPRRSLFLIRTFDASSFGVCYLLRTVMTSSLPVVLGI